jgi:hypothetical protein
MARISKNYNRWAISIAILFLTLSLLGCGGGGGSANNTASSSTAIASFVSDCTSEHRWLQKHEHEDDSSSDHSGCTPTSYTVSTTAGTHGTITPVSAVINQGDSIEFTITPDEGYIIQSVSGCGGSLTGNTYTTGAITADCTVTANFISDGSNSGNNNGSGCTPPTTSGTPWAYPCEISVAKAYNTVFLTAAGGGVPYDEASQEGLAALIADHASLEQQTNWTAWHSAASVQDPRADVTNVTVLTNETSNQLKFGIDVGGTQIEIYPALYPARPWTPPTRGWIDDPLGTPVTDAVTGELVSDWSTGVVNIPDLLITHGLPADSYFTFYVTNGAGTPNSMDISNTHRIEGNGTYNGGFLLGYEDGGSNGDHDYNDLTIYVNAPQSAPGGCMGHKPTILGTPNADIQVSGT